MLYKIHYYHSILKFLLKKKIINSFLYFEFFSKQSLLFESKIITDV